VNVQSPEIERPDFPRGRRGYDRDAVDAYVRALGEELALLRQDLEVARTQAPPGQASEQVRAIVDAVEASTGDVKRRAEAESLRITTEAAREAERTRQHALQEARERIDEVMREADVITQRFELMRSELDTLTDTARAGGARLAADLSLLRDNVAALDLAASQARVESPVLGDAAVPVQPAPVEHLELGIAPETAIAQAAASPPPLPPPSPHSISSPAPSEPALSDDSEGARLIAFNMALNGTPREQTARYLVENFDLSDRESLLEEVYARAGQR